MKKKMRTSTSSLLMRILAVMNVIPLVMFLSQGRLIWAGVSVLTIGWCVAWADHWENKARAEDRSRDG